MCRHFAVSENASTTCGLEPRISIISYTVVTSVNWTALHVFCLDAVCTFESHFLHRYMQVLEYMWLTVSCHTAAHHFPTTASSLLTLILIVPTQDIVEWVSTAVQTSLQDILVLGLSLEWTVALAIMERSELSNIITWVSMLDVCIST